MNRKLVAIVGVVLAMGSPGPVHADDPPVGRRFRYAGGAAEEVLAVGAGKITLRLAGFLAEPAFGDERLVALDVLRYERITGLSPREGQDLSNPLKDVRFAKVAREETLTISGRALPCTVLHEQAMLMVEREGRRVCEEVDRSIGSPTSFRGAYRSSITSPNP